MRCDHFLNLYRISLFPVSYHFKDQKEENGKKWWEKMVYHFLKEFTIYSAQRARHLRNRIFERISVGILISEGGVQKMRQAVVTLLEQIYDLLCSKKCTFEKCTFWRNLHWKLWFNEVGYGRPRPFPKFFLYSMSGATLREARASREQLIPTFICYSN